MANQFGRLRSRLLTPSMNETKLSTRGFHVKSPEARQRLETVGESFLTGYSYAAAASSTADAEVRLETVPPEFRGFAYEGAAMGMAVRDGLPIGGSRHVERFLAGRASKHTYMAYVGVGWAMARVPRFRWSRMYTADPLLRWLVLDGYGFHQAYFRTDTYVHGQYQDPGFAWPGAERSPYDNRVIDQGIGRAIWFVGGTDVERITALLDAFSEERHADLYAGAALAATYAGGVGKAELQLFSERAAKHRQWVAQGSAFAATARLEAGLGNEHTELATEVLCGITPEQAVNVCQEARPAPSSADTGTPAYEVWRCRIAERLAAGAGDRAE
jgi:enediyne biosynthesis protein E3